MRRWIWGCFLGAASVLSLIYFVIPHSAASKLCLYNGVGLLSVAALATNAIRQPRGTRAPWWFFAAGQASFLTADVCFYLLEQKYGETPFPSFADAFYLAMYPLVIVGLVLLVRQIAPGRDRASLIDAGAVAIAGFATFWVLFMDSAVADSNLSSLGRVITLAYPMMDVALIAVAVRLVITVHIRHASFALLGASILSLMIADTAYGVLNVTGDFHTGGVVDAFWLGFYVLFALSALHPSVMALPRPVRVETNRVTARHFVVMFLATLELPVINVLWGGEDDRLVTTIASGCLFVLVLVRVFGLMRAIEHGQDQLRHDARHDSLTGLANRAYFKERTAQAVTAAGDHRVFVLFIDLDDFKTVNDSLGHHSGDELLMVVARRLEGCVREDDIVARLGGDEFALLLRTAVDHDDAASVAARVLHTLSAPVDLGSRQVRLTASVGIAFPSSRTHNVDELLRDADVAMYLGKARGKGRYEFFEQEMYDDVVDRLDMKADLERALELDEFRLHYQPIFDLETDRLVKFEALLRWYHPVRGVVSPDQFIPLAEESGQIVSIGRWVLREACRQTRKWQLGGTGHTSLGISVNLSVRQLHSADVLQTVADALSESRLDAQSLTLEITESMLATDTELTTRALQQLKALRCGIALDDFGTGYSSLSYLRRFPVDHVKIDRTFVNELHRSSTSTALVQAIINLASALGASTTAEGIEHADQARVLQALGCERGQGFLFSRPLTAEACTALLRSAAATAGPEPATLPTWRRRSGTADSDSHRVEFARGLAGVEALADDLEQLHRATGSPVMARWPWQAEWMRVFRSWQPLAVTVRSGTGEELLAAALLAARNTADRTEIVAVGSGMSLHTALPSRDHDAAIALADAVTELLAGKASPWTLRFEQLAELDPVAAALADRLPGAELVAEPPVPRVIIEPGLGLESYLSKNQRKQIRRSLRQVEKDGLELRVRFHRGDGITDELRNELERIHVARDHDSRRSSDLDDPAMREVWRSIVEARHGAWEVEVASLRLDGELAAYVVGLLDGDCYRIYDGRMNSDYAEYSPGRLVEAATLQRVAAAGSFSVLDWMTGVAAEKILASNDAVGRMTLIASSVPASAQPAMPSLPLLDVGAVARA